MQVFRTESDFPEQIQILGVGLLMPNGKNAVDVEFAASRMSELSKKDKDGKLVVDENGAWTPLTGKALTSAAKAWADSIPGVEAVEIKESDVAKLRGAGGMRVELTAEDALAASQYYAQQTNPVVTITEGGAVVSAEAVTAEEAMEAEGEQLSSPEDDEGGEG